jgi:hypothetical protein
VTTILLAGLLVIFYMGGEAFLVIAGEVNSVLLLPLLFPLISPAIARAITLRVAS